MAYGARVRMPTEAVFEGIRRRTAQEMAGILRIGSLGGGGSRAGGEEEERGAAADVDMYVQRRRSLREERASVGCTTVCKLV